VKPQKTFFWFLLATFVFLLTVGGSGQRNDVYPEPIDLPPPSYPTDAFNARRGGIVSVSVTVDKKGKVTTGKVDGPLAPCSKRDDEAAASLRKAAVAAARLSTFKPGTTDGKFSAALGTSITYFFDPTDRNVRARAKFSLADLGENLNKRAVKLPRPDSPGHSLFGDVYVAVLVAEDGHVLEGGVYFGFPRYSEAALAAACKAQFTPTFVSGKPVKVSGVISYFFD
jgi:hypothetical protein